MYEVVTAAKLCIYILTWNVGNHSPYNISLNEALSLNGTSSCPDNQLPDIYVLGFQKVQSDRLTQWRNLFWDDKWTLKAANELSHYGYQKVKTAQMMGILVNVWSKKKHVTHIRNIETEKTGTGMSGDRDNQGAVSVRFSLYRQHVTFIVADLTDHAKKLSDPVKDYKHIVENHHYKYKGYHNISDQAVVFWLGDLNFRLNNSTLDVLDEIKHNNLDKLFALDQLSEVRKSGEAFDLMNEQQPTFPPTCNFIEGSSVYDSRLAPAWCDRILYRVVGDKHPREELTLQQLSYKSHSKYELSDHKPVTAEFLYTIRFMFDTMHPEPIQKEHVYTVA